MGGEAAIVLSCQFGHLNLLQHVRLLGSLDTDVKAQLSKLFCCISVITTECIFVIGEALVVRETARAREDGVHVGIDLRHILLAVFRDARLW